MDDALRIDTDGVEELADDLRRSLPRLTSAAGSVDGIAFGPASVGPALRALAAVYVDGAADIHSEIVSMRASLDRIADGMSSAAGVLDVTDTAAGDGIGAAGPS